MTNQQQPSTVPERPRKQNEKDYLLRYGWMYTGPTPHRWTDPIDKQVYSRAEALKVQQQRKPVREYSKGAVFSGGSESPPRVSACPRCGQPPMRELITANRVRFCCPYCPSVPASEGETFEEVAKQWNDPGWRWDSHPYARVHPVDDARVKEIRRRHGLTKFAFKNQVPPQAMADIDYLLSLLPQLSSGEPVENPNIHDPVPDELCPHVEGGAEMTGGWYFAARVPAVAVGMCHDCIVWCKQNLETKGRQSWDEYISKSGGLSNVYGK